MPISILSMPARTGSAPVNEIESSMRHFPLPASEHIKVRRTLTKRNACDPWGGAPWVGGQEGGHNLFLSHGYCSGDVWYNTVGSNGAAIKNHFSEPARFLQDYCQNRSHDEFAIKIREATEDLKSFGIVAHSQGGCASTHLWDNYYSGLDWGKRRALDGNTTGRQLIQSVGTPYGGTNLQGILSIVGGLTGLAGCGFTWELTYTGGALWKLGIDTDKRSSVRYRSTSFTDDFLSFDYCSAATDLFLTDPDDGVTERFAAQLSGAVNAGHREGWCHTIEMTDPAHYKDFAENVAANNRAVR
jgi:hypothetical protein